MNYFNKDPLDKYKNLKDRIPSIKIKNRDFMNKFHNLEMSSDFWWAISGEFAILAELATMQIAEDPRLLDELKDVSLITSNAFTSKILSCSIINLISRDCIFDKDFTLNTKVTKKSIDDLLTDDLEKNLIIKDNSEKAGTIIPMIALTNFLTKLRLEKIKFLYLKIKNKIKTIFNYINKSQDKIINTNNFDKNFNLVLNLFLPNNMKEYYPKWFSWLSNYLVKPKHKWKTYFGLERDIYQIILNAKSYQKYGDKNITIISHGNLNGPNTWWLWRLSLFPNMKLNINPTFNLPEISKKNISNDILFCTTPFPDPCQFFSIQHFWDFMKVYKSAIKLINKGIEKGKKINIRYKRLGYFSEFTAPFTREECKIPIEKGKFENVYNKYKLIVSMPLGTISVKCYQNNINCISYNYPYNLTSREAYTKANTYPGVYKDAEKFLLELEKKITEV